MLPWRIGRAFIARSHPSADDLLIVNSSQPVKSSFVTVVAWIFLVFSALSSAIGVLQNAMVWLVMRPHMRELGGTDSAPAKSATEWMAHHIELWFAAVLLVSLVTFGSSLGLLRRKDWARKTFIGVLMMGIAWMLFALVVQVGTLNSMPTTPGLERFALMSKLIVITSAIVGIAIAGAFGWIIKRLTTPGIRAEFA